MDSLVEIKPHFKELLDRGHWLFNAARLAPSEAEHAIYYHRYISPEQNAVIVDMGAGSGELGAMFNCIDPSMRVINVVNDPSLIMLMRGLNRECVEASFESTGLPDSCADIVMFNESIGHGDLNAALKEAYRVLKPEGTLTIKDFTPVAPKAEVIEFPSWEYVLHRVDTVINTAYKIGLTLENCSTPPMYTKHYFDIIRSKSTVEHLSDYDAKNLPFCMVLYKFKKGSLCGKSID